MPQALIRKLEHFTRLSAEDKLALERAFGLKVRRFGPRETIINEGDEPTFVNLVLSGWACRAKVLEDGRRQVISFFVPGDICDLKVFILKQMDHSIASLSPVTVAQIPSEVVEDLTDHHPRISRALWWASLVSEAIEREWIVNLGQREAEERLGHLFCELFYRLRAVGLTDGTSYHLPLSQSELAETVGISPVHVSRSLKQLREDGLIRLRNRTLHIPELQRLENAVLFNANYLHLGREGQAYDANAV